MHIAAAVFTAVVAWQFAQFSPAPPTPQIAAGSISGVITSADQGVPVRKASVRLTGLNPRVSQSTTTDAEGRYVFTGLAAGEYTLSASRAGYIDTVRGSRRPGPGAQGTLVALAHGQTLDNISWTLPRAGVITGVVVDEFGDPAFNVPVRAMRIVYTNGFKGLTSGGNGTSDDRGIYRIAGLLPGDYIVAAVPRDTVAAASAQAEALAEAVARAKAAGKPAPNVSAPPPVERVGYVPIYFPSTPHGASAASVPVGVGQEVAGIDLKLALMPTVSVAGRVTSNESTHPVSRLQLIDTSVPLSFIGIWFRDTSDSGTFSFPGVLPGNYVVKAYGTPGGQKGVAGGEMWGSAEIAVDERGIGDLVLAMRRGVTISGRIVTDSLPDADRSRVRVSLSPVASPTDWEMASIPLPADAGGAFRAVNVLPGMYRLHVTGLPDGWAVASARFADRDAADHHLIVDGSRDLIGEIEFTSKLSALAGQVSNADGSPAPHHTVIVFPADQAMWLPSSRRIHLLQPAADGRFTLRNLPPGDYRVAAILDPEPGRHFDRGYLAQVASTAETVRLNAGGAPTITLRAR